MFCKNCGKEIVGTNKCIYCGTAVFGVGGLIGNADSCLREEKTSKEYVIGETCDTTINCTECGTSLRIKKVAAKYRCPKCSNIIDGLAALKSKDLEKAKTTNQDSTNNAQSDKTILHEDTYGTYEQPSSTPNFGMKWFKFLIYFSLWAGGIINIISGAYQIYEYINTIEGTFKIVGIIFGVVCIGMGIFMIVTRFRLAGFKKGSPNLLYMSLIFNTVVPIIELVVFYLLLKQLSVSIYVLDYNYISIITTTVTNIVMLALNIVYFNKRKVLFVN